MDIEYGLNPAEWLHKEQVENLYKTDTKEYELNSFLFNYLKFL